MQQINQLQLPSAQFLCIKVTHRERKKQTLQTAKSIPLELVPCSTTE